MSFSEPELEYLASQRLGRLATLAPDGAPQNRPVGFRYNPEADTIGIFGWNIGASRKFCTEHDTYEHPGSNEVIRIHPQRTFAWGLDRNTQLPPDRRGRR